MAAYEVLLLNTAVPQIQAAQSGDTYVVPRDIAFSAALTLSAGTANGVPYLNGSKVLTTGSALTFDGTNLGVGGTSGYETANRTTIAAAGVNSALLGFKVGGASAGYAFADASHLEFGAPTGRYLSWDINGEQMRLTSTGLGIGTSSPGYKLDVAGSGRFGTGTGNPIVFINGGSSSGNGGYVQFQKAGANNFYVGHVSGVVGGTSNDGLLYNSSGNGLQIYTNNALAATLDSSGNLGIGTSSPVAKLDISNIGATQNGLRLTNFSGAAELASFTTDTSTGEIRIGGTNGAAGSYYPVFYAGGSERARITSGGDFLVGTASASTQITFVGSSGITYQRSTDNSFPGVFDYLKSRGSVASPTAVQNGDGLLLMRVAPYHGSAYTYLNSMTVEVDGTFTSGQNPPTRIAWYTNAANGSSTERARITSVGNFKIGGSADRATTEGTNQLVLFNGTAPVGTLANGVSFYSASGEARVMDAAGNSTLLSPHDQSTNEWIFHSKHTPTGKVLRIDVERLLKFVNDHFGLDAVHEFIEE